MKRWIFKSILSSFLYYSGAVWAFERARLALFGGRIKILAYHGVSKGPFYAEVFMDADKFESQVAFLQERYGVIHLKEAEGIIRNQKRIPKDKVVLTLDDGLRDNYENAYPLALKYGAPMTIYLTTGCLNSGMAPFFYNLVLAVENTSRGALDMSSRGMGSYPLGTHGEKEAAVLAIDRYGKTISPEDREKLLDSVLEALGLSRGDAAFQGKMLDWRQVNEMKTHGISFGAHSVTHPVLSRLPADRAEWEIRQSKMDVEANTGLPADSFAYPYGGNHRDIDGKTVELVKKCGFTSAVILNDSRNHGPDAMHVLGRIMVTNDMVSDCRNKFSKAMFACEMSGLFDLLLLRGLRS